MSQTLINDHRLNHLCCLYSSPPMPLSLCQDRKFVIANARVENCAIIFCNDGFCEMCGYSRAEVMQRPCTCGFLHGPRTAQRAIRQLQQALLGSEERKVQLVFYRKEGSCFLCLVDIVPVKSEDGTVIMFIMNFEPVSEKSLLDSLNKEANHSLPSAWFAPGGRGLGVRVPALLAGGGSKLSLSLSLRRDIAEAGGEQCSCESLAMEKLLSPAAGGQRRPGGASETVRPADHSSLQQLGGHLNPDVSYSASSLSPSRSRESFYSVRRVSSLDDIEGMRGDFERKFRGHHSSAGAVNHLRLTPNLLNSTSDSDLMKYRIPHITLNFMELHRDPTVAPGPEEIIASSKLKDRTHNVTEKVTQILRGDVVVAILGKNDIFGEPINLYARPGKSNADVRALTYCDLHKIQREDLLEVLEMYPEFSDHYWTNLEITFNLRDTNMIPGSLSSDDSDGGFGKLRRRKLSFRRRAEHDHEKTGEELQGERNTREMGGPHCEGGRQPWAGCSSSPSLSQSSPEDIKRPQSSTVELSPSSAQHLDFISVQGSSTETQRNSMDNCNPLSGAFAGVSNIFSFWGETRSQTYQELSRSMAPVHSPHPNPALGTGRPQWAEVHCRLDLLQKQLNRLESRMATDISAVMQLLQRQMALVPPSYSTVSSPPRASPHTPDHSPDQPQAPRPNHNHRLSQSQCPRTCTDLWDHVQCLQGDCKPGCRCPEGWLLQDGQCVPVTQCRCGLPTANVTTEYRPGDEVWRDCNNCTCVAGRLACSEQPCPVYSAWSAWSPCSVSCGEGQTSRTRTCHPIPGSAACQQLVQHTACHHRACPVDCAVNSWSEWSECSANCGGGFRTRNRGIVREAEPGGAPCPHILTFQTPCNPHSCTPECPGEQVFGLCANACPRACSDLWPGVQCQQSQCEPGCLCPTGQVLQGEECVSLDGCRCPHPPAPAPGLVNISLVQSEEQPPGAVYLDQCNTCVCEKGIFNCSERDCDVDCIWSAWSGWSECSVTCGSGVQVSTRLPARDREYGGRECQGPREQRQPCTTADCECPEGERWSRGSAETATETETETVCERVCTDLHQDMAQNCSGLGERGRCVCAAGRYRTTAGQCVTPAYCPCADGHTVYPPGFEWDEGCLSCRCVNGMKACTAACPPLLCLEGQVKVEEVGSCCPVCRREIPGSRSEICRRFTELRNISKGDCHLRNVEVSYCSGSCLSTVYVIPEEPYLRSECDCCSYRLDPELPVRFVVLECGDGETETLVLPVIHSCECSGCQGGDFSGR
ncbi:potassium voltage-gated channel subfamily H member 2-like [Callorhinchus milii]|uniref:potassium voltage-gated channel subfamily H member 2-like n=1 Tax=Callorhinchus milii TaxID=7868 RepID=UPI001C3F66D8|nr:potassium voltage-gated channel subfamily H member 2-like [Callorhinchus milii]